MHGAACVIVNVFPAIVRVPVRLDVDEFVATMKVTVPFPRPGPALSTATQATLLSAVHAQVDAAVTVLVPEPPSDVNERLVGEMDVVQALGAACVTVNVAPAIESVPMRAALPVCVAMLNATLPGPVPLAPLVTLIHGTLLAACHTQAALLVVTVLLPVPPSGEIDIDPGEMP